MEHHYHDKTKMKTIPLGVHFMGPWRSVHAKLKQMAKTKSCLLKKAHALKKTTTTPASTKIDGATNGTYECLQEKEQLRRNERLRRQHGMDRQGWKRPFGQNMKALKFQTLLRTQYLGDTCTLDDQVYANK
jgi:hypothetical protein